MRKSYSTRHPIDPPHETFGLSRREFSDLSENAARALDWLNLN